MLKSEIHGPPPNWSEIFKILLVQVRSGTNRFWSVNPWLECYFSVHHKNLFRLREELQVLYWMFFLIFQLFYFERFYIGSPIGQPMRERFEIFPESTYRRPLVICNRLLPSIFAIAKILKAILHFTTETFALNDYTVNRVKNVIFILNLKRVQRRISPNDKKSLEKPY